MSDVLVRMFGFYATVIFGDTLVLDRWIWLKRRLPTTRNLEKVLDIGCGSGAFCIGAAKRGYAVTGLSWDEVNQQKAKQRANLCDVKADFPIQDLRGLGLRS